MQISRIFTQNNCYAILGLVASAYAPDGIIEAVESKDYKFLVGVQWHSEYLNSELDKNLFKRLIEASS